MFQLVMGVILGLITLTANANSRALIGVVDLTYHASKNLWIYRLEQKHAIKVIQKKTKKHYDSVKVLSGTEATLNQFLSELKKIKENSAITKVDVVFYIHGETINSPKGRSLCFYGQPCVQVDLLQEKIKAVEAPLGILYSDACWGGEHMPAMMAAGFEAVAGSTKVDGNQTSDLRRFLKAWGRGKSFQEAINFANRNPITPLKDFLVKDAKSFKLTLGDVETSINDL